MADGIARRVRHAQFRASRRLQTHEGAGVFHRPARVFAAVHHGADGEQGVGTRRAREHHAGEQQRRTGACGERHGDSFYRQTLKHETLFRTRCMIVDDARIMVARRVCSQELFSQFPDSLAFNDDGAGAGAG
jgi:hypothetical protein